jgi:vacuolar-type H+-ATPase subunit I/STV1
MVSTLRLENMANKAILSFLHSSGRKSLHKNVYTHWWGTLPGSVLIVYTNDQSSSTKMMWYIMRNTISIGLLQLLTSMSMSFTKQMYRNTMIQQMITKNPYGNLRLKNYYNILLYFKLLVNCLFYSHFFIPVLLFNIFMQI